MNYHGINAAGLNRGVELLTVISAESTISGGVTADVDAQRRKRASAAFICRATASPISPANAIVGGSVAFAGSGRVGGAVTVRPTVALLGRAQYGLRRTSVLYHASAAMTAGFQFLTPMEIVAASSTIVASGALSVADEALRALEINFQGACAASGAAFAIRGGDGVFSWPSSLIVEPGVNGVHYFIGLVRASGAMTLAPSISRGGGADVFVNGTMSDVLSQRIQQKKGSGSARGELTVSDVRRVRRAAASAVVVWGLTPVAGRAKAGGAAFFGGLACGIIAHKWCVTRYGGSDAILGATVAASGVRKARPTAGGAAVGELSVGFFVQRGASATGTAQTAWAVEGRREREGACAVAGLGSFEALASAEISETVDLLTGTGFAVGATLWPTKIFGADGQFSAEDTQIYYAIPGSSVAQSSSILDASPRLIQGAHAVFLGEVIADSSDLGVRLALQGRASFLPVVDFSNSATLMSAADGSFLGGGIFRVYAIFATAPEVRTAVVQKETYAMQVPVEYRGSRVV